MKTEDNNLYKSMYVLGEEEYKQFKKFKASLVPKEGEEEASATCKICGKKFINANVLAHHNKSHVDGFQCNICLKVFKHRRTLTMHLKSHALQVSDDSRKEPQDAARLRKTLQDTAKSCKMLFKFR